MGNKNSFILFFLRQKLNTPSFGKSFKLILILQSNKLYFLQTFFINSIYWFLRPLLINPFDSFISTISLFFIIIHIIESFILYISFFFIYFSLFFICSNIIFLNILFSYNIFLSSKLFFNLKVKSL